MYITTTNFATVFQVFRIGVKQTFTIDHGTTQRKVISCRNKKQRTSYLKN